MESKCGKWTHVIDAMPQDMEHILIYNEEFDDLFETVYHADCDMYYWAQEKCYFDRALFWRHSNGTAITNYVYDDDDL